MVLIVKRAASQKTVQVDRRTGPFCGKARIWKVLIKESKCCKGDREKICSAVLPSYLFLLYSAVRFRSLRCSPVRCIKERAKPSGLN